MTSPVRNRGHVRNHDNKILYNSKNHDNNTNSKINIFYYRLIIVILTIEKCLIAVISHVTTIVRIRTEIVISELCLIIVVPA